VTNGDRQSENRLWEQSDKPAQVGERSLNPESDYDYGSRTGVWRLLRIFERHQFPVTAYAIGQAFEKNLEAAEAFTQNGHEIASHGYRCVGFSRRPLSIYFSLFFFFSSLSPSFPLVVTSW
jgi:peptidoglycan/xylan/chitin deacetylase (PgdA/CDA1 family)